MTKKETSSNPVVVRYDHVNCEVKCARQAGGQAGEVCDSMRVLDL